MASKLVEDSLSYGKDSQTQTAIETLSDWSQSMWRESRYERLLNRFVKIHRKYLGMTRACLFTLKYQGSRISFNDPELKLSNIAGFDNSFMAQLEQSLQKINLKSQEYSQGLNSYFIAGRDIYFALLGDSASVWQILIWESERKSDQSISGEQVETYSDFLTRQLQGGQVWFSRLDKTQALLYKDDLTSLFNFRYLELALDSEIRRAQRFMTSFSLLFIDLDNFKMINDKFGHLAGSSILKQTADVLRDTAREIDSVIRYGGDEFIILLLGATPTTGFLAGERIRRRIEDTRFMLDDGNHVSLTASIGVASFPNHAQDKESLLKMADQMMYEGKKIGKNKVTLYSRSQDEKQTLAKAK